MSSHSPGALWQRRDVATEFVDVRRKLIPLVHAQEQLLRELITRRGRTIKRFLDLGAGGGALRSS